MTEEFDLKRYQDPLVIQRALLDAKTIAAFLKHCQNAERSEQQMSRLNGCPKKADRASGATCSAPLSD